MGVCVCNCLYLFYVVHFVILSSLVDMQLRVKITLIFSCCFQFYLAGQVGLDPSEEGLWKAGFYRPHAIHDSMLRLLREMISHWCQRGNHPLAFLTSVNQ